MSDRQDRGQLPWGTWRRCKSCGFRVWETKRGKLCRHVPEAREGDTSADPMAKLSGGNYKAAQRCEGSGS